MNAYGITYLLGAVITCIVVTLGINHDSPSTDMVDATLAVWCGLTWGLLWPITVPVLLVAAALRRSTRFRH